MFKCSACFTFDFIFMKRDPKKKKPLMTRFYNTITAKIAAFNRTISAPIFRMFHICQLGGLYDLMTPKVRR